VQVERVPAAVLADGGTPDLRRARKALSRPNEVARAVARWIAGGMSKFVRRLVAASSNLAPLLDELGGDWRAETKLLPARAYVLAWSGV